MVCCNGITIFSVLQTYFDLMGKGVDLDKWDVVIMLEVSDFTTTSYSAH